MLDLQTYSRQDLLDIYKMERFDSLKAKLKRRGYEFTVNGRGTTATVTITKVPPRFREFCIEELHYDTHTDFARLKHFLYSLMFDEDFRKLPYVTMKEYMVGTMEVTNQTISKWIQQLYKENLISDGEMIYYSINKVTGTYKTITKEEHDEAWKRYWEIRNDEDEKPTGQYHIAVMEMYDFIGGFPYKKPDIVFNALEYERLDELEKILKKEIDIEE